MKDFKEKTIRGGFAKLCGQAIGFVIRIGQMAVMARLLDPKDFGLVAMVTVVTGIYGLFTSAGLSSATIQSASINDEQISTLFWINLLVGAVLAVLCLVSAPVIVLFYHEPRLFWVTVAMAAGFIFNAAGVQHFAILQRQIRFVALTVIDILSTLLTLAIGVGMAVAGFGYWALVAMSIAYPAICTICYVLTTAWIPGLPRRGAGVRSMLHFGGVITLNGLVVYIAYNFEKILLGRFWGADALGIYGRAYQIANIPTQNINMAVGGVVFSSLSRVQDDPERCKSIFLKCYSLVLSMTIPITIFSAVFANEIILVLLGPKWKEAAVIFRLLTPTILIFGMINPFGNLLFAIGRTGRSLKLALVIAPLVITSYVLGMPYGPRGVAFAYSAAMTLWFIPHIVWCIHGTAISPRDILRTVKQPYLAALAAALFTSLFQFFLGHLVSPIPRLVLGGAILFGSYICMLLFVLGQKEFYLDLVRGLKGAATSDAKELEPAPADP